MMASKGAADIFAVADGRVDEASGRVVEVRSVTEVELNRSVAKGVNALVEFEDWI